MAIPLRKDQPDFDQPEFEQETITAEEITTADLAQGKRPVSEMRTPHPVAPEAGFESSSRASSVTNIEPSSTANFAQRAPASSAPLFPGGELEGLRTRWKEVQTAFVDEPRKAVEQADSLVASAMKRLAEVFAEERAGLEKQWDRGDNVSTEDLRVALQRYRSFFDRLLSV